MSIDNETQYAPTAHGSLRICTDAAGRDFDDENVGDILVPGPLVSEVLATHALLEERDRLRVALQRLTNATSERSPLALTWEQCDAVLQAMKALTPAASAEPVGGDVPWPDPPTEYEKLQSRDDYEARHGVRLDGEESASAPGRGAGT